jgi:plastocyanin
MLAYRSLCPGTVACIAAAVAACGGGGGGGGGANNARPRTAAETTAATPAGVAAAPAEGGKALPATGNVWVVKMYGDDKGYRFEPKALTISVGDAVSWRFVSGGPHDVTFWADSIPQGAQSQLQANMSSALAPLTAPMTMNPGDNYFVSFAGVPKGVYHYYCIPHLAMGMVATLTVK